jgi:ABC-type sugar transport system ATPase subunit
MAGIVFDHVTKRYPDGTLAVDASERDIAMVFQSCARDQTEPMTLGQRVTVLDRGVVQQVAAAP